MSLLALCEWCEASTLAQMIRDSTWIFPVIEAGHLIALAAIGGAVLWLDLRFLGYGLSNQPTSFVAAQARPWLVCSVVAMFATGIPLFLSEATKCYYSPAFRAKMIFLFLALAFTFTVRHRIAFSHDERGWKPYAVAAISLSLWTAVGAMGKGIGFY
jgi:hypothetical protein